MGTRNSFKGIIRGVGGGSRKRAMMNPYGLTDQQIEFCLEYCKDLSVARAYSKVYPTADLSRSRTNADKLWAKPEVQAYVNELMAKKVEKHELSIDETLDVLNELLHDKKQSGAVRVQAADKLLKYFGGYVKHQEAGASKNVFLGMTEEDLKKNSAALLLQFKENNVKGKIVEDISFETISYEEVPIEQPVESSEKRNQLGSRELRIDE